ncbi:hypothetical protein BT96DRAFT_993165 [Gymnopus androsaceus JB14]|uniref:Uncharacterized protein n=1 Tax=Gymnopus androsaceus JB14 TaxID=1447944 RepID=A0A6A4HPB6_9AGAR|nr:hypothetical protein BT96DRAFT_993165 [Gymnopus androsaceus JB14]
MDLFAPRATSLTHPSSALSLNIRTFIATSITSETTVPPATSTGVGFTFLSFTEPDSDISTGLPNEPITSETIAPPVTTTGVGLTFLSSTPSDSNTAGLPSEPTSLITLSPSIFPSSSSEGKESMLTPTDSTVNSIAATSISTSFHLSSTKLTFLSAQNSSMSDGGVATISSSVSEPSIFKPEHSDSVTR